MISELFDGIPDQNIVFVFAHPDDEVTISSRISKHAGALMVHVTDGGPHDKVDWKGLPTRKAYTDQRADELRRALEVVGHRGTQICLDIIDGTAAYRMVEITEKLKKLFLANNTLVVITHSFEGGHPDHDAVAFAVHTAVGLLPRKSRIVEVPLYRMSDDVPSQLIWQRFVHLPSAMEFTELLSHEERDAKLRMCEAYISQREVLNSLILNYEYYRVAPDYNFELPANHGRLSSLYQRFGIDSQEWMRLVTTAF